MLFEFLKYVQPTHYFTLKRKDGSYIYPLVSELPEAILSQLKRDTGYKSAIAAAYDLSWQAIRKGYIGPALTYTAFERVPVADEYRFLRKYFHPVWASYVLLLRLLCFKNPIAEISGWKQSRKVTRNTRILPFTYPGWNAQGAGLLETRPLVSVVIPTLNRYSYLKDVLTDFEKQTYPHFEVIVIDQSQPFDQDFYSSYDMDLKVLQQEEPALWLARNTAVRNAKGAIIAFSEDDVRIQPDWLENHLRCLGCFGAGISAGVFYPEGSSIPTDRSFFCIASQFATGNAMIYKTIFEEIGLFDRQFEKQRMGDGEFGLRAYLHGIKSISNPFASCIDVKAPSGGLRQMGSWDAFRPKKLFSPRPLPSVLYFFRRYYGTKLTLLALLKSVPPSIVPYRFKKSRKWLLFGIFISVLLLPVILIQVGISWRKASKKLTQGPLIRESD